MSTYLTSAISTIYGNDDDFIILGLTGRTGSGCSTVAKLLKSEKHEIKHALFNGDIPHSNEERKEKILLRNFEKDWSSFCILQARSILTLMFSKISNENIRDCLRSAKNNIDEDTIKIAIEKLNLIKENNAEIESNKNSNPKEFYTNTLPSACEEIKQLLGESTFVSLYQKIGTNVRMSGSPHDDGMFEGKFFTLAEKLNSIIKIIRDSDKGKSEKTLVVIDAIRSPLEAIYFQERYAAFFLVAVSCPDEHRKRRLRQLKYSESDIKKLDEQEYKSRDIDSEETYSIQDIQACLQRADIYISNPDVSNAVSEFKLLANQLIKFTSLMRRPGLVTPSAMERCMQIAYTAKLNSGCISRQVGAVITDENFSLQAVGWNDSPHGQVPCNLRNRVDLTNGKDQTAYSEYEKNDDEFLNHIKEGTKKYISITETGRNLPYCFKSEFNKLKNKDNQVHTRSLHAEENAFLQISKYGGRGIEGGKLFTTASPCELCAKKAYQLGIKSIYYIDPYPGIAMHHVIMGGTKNPELILFSGAIGKAFHRLYTPIIPYKDELKALSQDA
jgi:dCMP deaminase